MGKKETTFTNITNGDEVNKGSDLSEIPKEQISKRESIVIAKCTAIAFLIGHCCVCKSMSLSA
jgi:hypothetical protein